MTDATKVLLISPRFAGRTFLSLEAVCEIYGGRAMTAPLGLITAPAGAILCVFVMCGLGATTWIRFIVWFAVGLAVYALYGFRHSRLRSG